jgi:hypothetical protein
VVVRLRGPVSCGKLVYEFETKVSDVSPGPLRRELRDQPMDGGERAWIDSDINPAVVTKLSDRGSLESVGVVTDVGRFLNLLWQRLQKQDERELVAA